MDKITKAFFRKCPILDRKNFKNAKCILPISIGQKCHEGTKFLSVMSLIERSFKECTILVDDSIQRYTMKINSNENLDYLRSVALEEGDKWIIRNRETYSKLSIPYKIIRWDDYFFSENFKNKLLLINNEYEKNSLYKEIFNLTVKNFLSRYEKNTFKLNVNQYENAVDLCLKYLKEECACMCLWAEDKYDFEVYPSGRNEAMIATYEIFVKPIYPNILKSVSLYFKKNKSTLRPEKRKEEVFS